MQISRGIFFHIYLCMSKKKCNFAAEKYDNDACFG